MNKLKRFAALLLALVLALGLLGCSKKENGGNGPGTQTQAPADPQAELEKKLKGVEKAKLDHVYSVEYLKTVLEGDTNVETVTEAAGKIYITASFSREVPIPEEPEATQYIWGTELYLMEETGELKKLLTFTQESEYDEENSRSRESYVNSISIAPDGTLWYMKEQYLNDWSDPENYIWEQQSSLVHADLTGKELLSIPLEELRDPANPDEYLYIGKLVFAGNGNILAQTGSGLIGLSPEGKVLYRSGGDAENTYMEGICVTGSGRIIAVIYKVNPADYSGSYCLVEVDPDTGNLTDLGADMSTQMMYGTGQFLGGQGDTLLMGTTTGIDSYDLGTHTRSELLNWLNSDVNVNYVQSVVPLSDGRFLIAERNWQRDDSMKLAYLNPVGESVEKYLIHFAALYLDDTLTNTIISYNKQNDLFRIVFDDYSRFSTEEDYQAGLKQLNQDIISGKIPDIFSMDGLPYDVYASKGLLLDLKPRLEQDPDLRMEDYLENVFKAVERDGKIYSLIPAFTLHTLAAKESLVGKTPGWTMEDLQKVIRAHPEAAVFSDTTRESALGILLEENMDAFIDPETGACSFNSPEFIQLLELVKTFPENIDWEKIANDDPTYWERQEGQYREGRTLLMSTYLSSYASIRDLYYQFDSDCTFIGFPGAKGSGAVIAPRMEIAISGRTKLDDQCWDFLRYLLSEEYQSDLGDWCFPVRLDALQAMEEKAMTEEGGGNILYDGPRGGGMVYYETAAEGDVMEPAEGAEENTEGTEDGEASAGVLIPEESTSPGDLEPEEPVMPDPEPGYEDWWSRPLTQEMADKITDVVKGAVQVYRAQTEVMAIIQEEAGAFFSGQKTAQAVADTIQSRAYLYVMESR